MAVAVAVAIADAGDVVVVSGGVGDEAGWD